MTDTTQVAIIMGSKTDYPKMKPAQDILASLGISSTIKVVSAHRTPKAMVEFAETAHIKGFQVIIAGAGGAAHLPGMVAALTPLPVIGVPVNVTAMDGLDALLSIVQMPGGVPVATVAIDGAKNAAYLAARILGASDESVREKLLTVAAEQRELVAQMNKDIESES